MRGFSASHRVLHQLSIVAILAGLIGPLTPGSRPALAAGAAPAPSVTTRPAADATASAVTAIMLPVDITSGETRFSAPQATTPAAQPPSGRAIHLKSRDFQPTTVDRVALQAAASADAARVHILLQLDFIPNEAAKAEYAKRGVQLLAYVPDYAWLASVPGVTPEAALSLPGVTWAGPLAVADKLDPAIVNGEWGSYNRTPDGTVAAYAVIFSDVDWATGRALIESYGASIVSELPDVQSFVVEMPQANLNALAAEDSIQWLEPAEPALQTTNDNTRQLIGVNTVQSAPYNLTGSGIDILIYDGGIVTPTHADFTGRLTIGDAAPVSDHSTHVAGTAAGSGALSASAGGTANQWRGMAPGADIISYGFQWSGIGMLFYNNPGDIQADWAAAQNTYGADLGSASLGSNIYANYPMSCTLMGNYGMTSILMDQIIRGGNATVGVGDKYIATWAAGNERGSGSSCGTYATMAPPASAKNPIHVGASDVSNNMSTFSSWGPTDDGRIKPIVVAPGVNIRSTIPSMFTNSSSRNCDGSGDDYCYPYDLMSGTSMATPAVAGSIALMLQRYRAVYATSGNFWPSTAKAILMQTAVDFGNAGPDYQWGFGRVNIQAAVDLITRQAFLQDSVADDATDVFHFAVPTNTVPAQVVLAWDDYEATFNANPTLINNLDLELESPSGVIWRPWVLNAGSPAALATRNVNNVDNQEEVTIPNPEVGTWLVRVKGTTVPQGPQDYSLACEGCQALNLGVCQGTGLSAPALPESPLAPAGPALSSEDGTPVTSPSQAASLSAGEQWQRSLEGGSAQPVPAGGQDEDGAPALALAQPDAAAAAEQAKQDRIQAALRAFDAARKAGGAAVIAFDATASDEVRAVIAPAVEEAKLALAVQNAPAKPAGPQAPAALRVGVNGACAYNTIQEAVSAAPTNSTIRVAGEWFNENIDITGTRVLTIEGGYNATCTALNASTTTVDAIAAGSTIDVSGNGRLVLRNLILGWGSSIGAGLDLIGSVHVTLDNVRIENNHGSSGGGLYVGSGTVVTLTNGSQVAFNTGSTGAGAIVYGRLTALGNSTDFNGNCATTDGGNVAVPGGTLYMDNADLYAGKAAGATGRGGGVYATSGALITLTNSVFVGESAPCCQTAYEGGGIYANASRVFLLGAATTVLRNAAANNGGGIYLTNGSLLQSAGANVGNTSSSTNDNTAVLGAGVYAVSSTIDFSGRIINNTAQSQGAGLYASQSVLALTNASVGGTALNEPNVISSTALYADGYGVGLFLVNSSATLSNTVIASNTHRVSNLARGGAIYLTSNSAVTLTNSRVERHAALAPSAGRGGAFYVELGSRLLLDNTDVLSNTASTNGGAVRFIGGSTLDVRNGSLLQNNRTSTGEGGAIAAVSGVFTVTVTDSALLDNSAATDGGAIDIDAGKLSFLGAWDVRFNDAGGNGGAVNASATANIDFNVSGGPSYLAVNTAAGDGGALYVTGNDTVQLYATGGFPLNLNTNIAGGNGGAAFANNGALFDVYGQVQATSNLAGGNGGVFYLSGGSRVWFDDSGSTRPQIWVNSADNGGAVYAAGSPRVECDGADFGTVANGNKALAGSGGAIYLSGSTLTADNCTFRSGRATLNGAAVAAYTSSVSIDTDYPTLAPTPDAGRSALSPSDPLATTCTPPGPRCSELFGNIADSDSNSSGDGGAVYANNSMLHINTSYLHRNQAYRGGAVYQEGASGLGWLTNTLIYSNVSTTNLGAGARLSGGVLTATHVTFANNTGGAGLSHNATEPRIFNSIIWGNSVGEFDVTPVASCNIDQAGSAGSATDPLFAAPDAGEDYHVLLGSPALDACLTGAAIDLENHARPVGAAFDMGAYEGAAIRVYLPIVLR